MQLENPGYSIEGSYDCSFEFFDKNKILCFVVHVLTLRSPSRYDLSLLFDKQLPEFLKTFLALSDDHGQFESSCCFMIAQMWLSVTMCICRLT